MRSARYRWLSTALLAIAALWLAPAPWPEPFAAELPYPSGRIVLRISGHIAHRNAGEDAVFDREQLEALPQFTLRTTTPWTDGVTEFQGPLGRDVLALAGATGTILRARAINDYEVEIPVEDFRNHDVVLAMRRDGKSMGVRDKGPLWVIYPWSQSPQLRNERYHGRSIWQLKELVVE